MLDAQCRVVRREPLGQGDQRARHCLSQGRFLHLVGDNVVVIVGALGALLPLADCTFGHDNRLIVLHDDAPFVCFASRATGVSKVD